MTYQTVNYTPPSVTPFDCALTRADFSPGRANLPVLPMLPSGPLTRQIATGDFREQCRAHLTSTALENVAALSQMEAYLDQAAPSGYRRYRAIVDAYALGAIAAIAKGGV